MRTDKLDYDLPAALIAQQPCTTRSESRLLVLNRTTGALTDSKFSSIGQYLSKGDCLVVNNTKVLPARFFARRVSGGKLEGLFLCEQANGLWQVMLRGAGRVKIGEKIRLKDKTGADYCRAELPEKPEGGEYRLKIESDDDLHTILGRIGFTPLPPYIKRGTDLSQDEIDRRRYQTVYASADGAVAAPTAGLHFTDELIDRLKDKGVQFASVTLHVGPGTFKPVTTETLEEHKMHSERFEIDKQNSDIINNTKNSGGKIIAVGTTSVRVLETVAENGQVKPGNGETALFIMPGYDFKIVDAMITNFHLPRSTLLALVAAFAGLDNILTAYRHAVRNNYRFYSYGDATLIV
jgi:S-adenosylmethionine:tRNA ribosyltransferase-isomerase